MKKKEKTIMKKKCIIISAIAVTVSAAVVCVIKFIKSRRKLRRKVR
jgi:hypothetical protein